MQKTDLLRFKIDTEKLWGIYRGIVEDNDDPLRLGRVRVRIMGVHTEEQAGDLNQVPWEELVWSHPIGPIFEGSISGQGAFCVPVKGSHVFIFFENGNMMQPRHFGTAAGFPIDGAKYSQLEKQDGFRDPDEWYPLDDHIEEQDWHRLARVDKLAETYLQIKLDNLDLAVPYAFGAVWDEQPPMYEAEYPENNVFATHDDFEENIVVELDSTFGAERFAWWHPSMSYMEVNFEGRMTFRNTWHRWDICDGIVHTHYMIDHFKTIDKSLIFLIQKDEFREIKGNRWTKIWGASDWRKVYGNVYEWTKGATIYLGEGDTDSTILGNVNERIEGGLIRYIGGGMLSWIAGTKQSSIIGDDKLFVGGTKQSSVTGNIESTTLEEMILMAKGFNVNASERVLIHSTGAFNLQSDLDMGIKSLGIIRLDGTQVLIGAPVTHVNPVDAPIVEVPEPPAPSEPPDSPAPPAPDIPPDFIPPDVPVEMPEPGC